MADSWKWTNQERALRSAARIPWDGRGQGDLSNVADNEKQACFTFRLILFIIYHIYCEDFLINLFA